MMTPKQIKELRERLRFTQRQFADVFPCGLETIRSWEQGRHKPGSLALRRLMELDREGKER
mgnify:FL=1